MSKAAQWFVMPSFCCTRQAVLGNTKSGVEVATMIRSMSWRSIPAASIACSAACTARSLAVTSGSAQCRAEMPLRETIHSSLVSMPRSASCAASS
ncbi:hypothetical protein D3C87_1164190 [compost metagenome]